MTRFQTRHSGTNIGRAHFLGTSARSPKTTSVTPTLSFVWSETQLKHSARCVVADPVVRKRMTGKCMIDVFGGSGFVAKEANPLGLRGYVFDTKFGPRCEQDVPAGISVAAMISHDYTSRALPKSFRASACFLDFACRGFWTHPCDSWLWDVPTLSAQPRTAVALAFFFFSTESVHCFS